MSESATQTHKETMSFQAEVKQVLDLMIHSLYSNREIFLRELISNASDAADKLRFEALSDDALFEGDGDLHLTIALDKEARTLTLTDNGIGMSRQEVIDNIGTIARSGTRAFLENMSGDAKKDAHLIGQFGVGFYSAFIVADKVTLTTRRAGLSAEHGVRWESTGDGSYSLETVEQAARGTSVTLHLREDAGEFLDGWRIKSIVRKYSDHIPFPIRMLGDADAEEGEEVKIETINEASALWTRSKDSISEEEYSAFYNHVGHDFEAPLAHLHAKLEGKHEYTLLLYLPKNPPFDLWHTDAKHGVKLYVRRVFIMEANEKLLPRYLRFVRGVMDTNDLPLNVSREILQSSPAIEAMKKGATKRLLGLIEELAKAEEQERFNTLWDAFGNVLKEGVIEDFENRDRIARLLRFSSTASENDEQRVSLSDYIGRMQPGQETIYFITADTLAAARNSPHLELFRKKRVEVLLLADRIDEWLVGHMSEFEGKKLQSISRGKVDLSAIGDAEETKVDEAAASPIAERIKSALGEKVKEVRATNRLTESASCIVADEHGLSSQMERILKQVGQAVPKSQPILEINPEHALVRRVADASDEIVADLAEILLDQAILAEGGKLEDPAGFVRRINKLLG